jgi:Fe-S cluster biosynthesis and repair protein YggX
VMDITNAKKANKPLGDNSIFENISQNKWVSYQKLKNILLDKNELYLSSLASAFLLFEAKCK